MVYIESISYHIIWYILYYFHILDIYVLYEWKSKQLLVYQ